MARRIGLTAAGLMGLALVSIAKPAAADAVSDFYKGKTVRVYVGASAGGGYDLVARTIAQRMTAFIPGNPSMVVENMPAAGGLVMLNSFYNNAARDGTAVAVPTNALALEPKLKVLTRAGGTANFDVTKFNWLGTAARQPQVLFVWHKAGVQNVEDLKKTKTIIAALSPGSDSFILPNVMNKLLGAQMQIVPGYEGHGDTFVALERGEVQGYNDSYAGLAGNKPDWIRDKLVHILIQFGRNKLPQLPDVPTAIDVVKDPIDKEALAFYASKYDLAYTMITPPGVPAERIAALRTAFDQTMRDPEYQANAKKIELANNPLNGDEVTKLVNDIQQAPQGAVDRMRDLMTVEKK